MRPRLLAGTASRLTDATPSHTVSGQIDETDSNSFRLRAGQARRVHRGDTRPAWVDVVGIDIDAEKVRKINAGQPPVEEPLLAETITAGQGRLRATQDYREAVATDVTFFIPPSPSLPDGSFSNEFLLRAMQPVAAAVREKGKKGHLFVCSSTTTPGAVDTVLIPMLERETGGVCGRDFGMCYNPEFIALGNVVNGLLEPDMVLIGESDPASGAVLEELYKRYNRNSPRIARMSIISAELTKISVNSYITMKISFTNQLRMIAEQFPKANIHNILDAIGSDSRIGQKYLRAGLSYGGPCFPRDNRLAGLHRPPAGPGSAAGRSLRPRQPAHKPRPVREGQAARDQERHRRRPGPGLQARHLYHRGSRRLLPGATTQSATAIRWSCTITAPGPPLPPACTSSSTWTTRPSSRTGQTSSWP